MKVIVSVLLLGRNSRNYFIVLSDLKLIVIEIFHIAWVLKGNGKVYDSFGLSHCSGSDPNVVNFDLVVKLKIDRFPNAHGIQIRSPIPGILIASFSGMSILKGHTIVLLTEVILLLRRINPHF